METIPNSMVDGKILKSKEFKIEGKDKNIYNIKISQTINTLVLQTTIEKDLLQIIYKTEMSLEQFHNLNNFLKLYETIDKLFSDFFEKLDKEEILLTKVGNNLELTLKIIIWKKAEEIHFNLLPEKVNINNLINFAKKAEEEINELKSINTKILKDFSEYQKKMENEINNIKKENKHLTERIKNIIEEEFNSKIIQEKNKNKFIELIKPGIKNFDSSKIIKFKLLFRATKDGDDNNKFHKKCDNKGKTITIIQTKDNFIFGGYTSDNWNEYDGHKKTENTFIFSLNKNKIYKGKNGGYIHCEKGHGPWFCGCSGANGKYLSDNKKCFQFELKENNINWDNFTEEFELIGGKKNFVVNELEVFKVSFI